MNTRCENSLLCTLDESSWARWRTHLEKVELKLGSVLYESGLPQTHVYFPSTAIVALSYTLESGATAEIGVVGNEGLVGFSLMFGSKSTPGRAIVQCAGHGYRVDAAWFVHEAALPATQSAFLPFAMALIVQMMQTAICNRHHRLEQQLCRWLLISLTAWADSNSA